MNMLAMSFSMPHALLVGVVLWQLTVASSEVYFPDCRAIAGIKRVFSVMHWTYLELHDSEGISFWTYNLEFGRYIKADWLYMLTGAGLNAVLWNGTYLTVRQRLKPEKKIDIIYHSEGQIFIQLAEDGKNSLKFDFANNDEMVYQLGPIFDPTKVYLINRDSKQLNCTFAKQCNALKQMNISFSSVFNVSDAVYGFASHDQIVAYNKSQVQFERLLKCTQHWFVQPLVLVAAIGQVVLIIVLIVLNIYLAARGLTRKAHQPSDRVASRNVSQCNPSTEATASSISSTGQSSQVIDRRSSTKPTTKTVTLAGQSNVVRGQSAPWATSTTDSLVDCYNGPYGKDYEPQTKAKINY